MQKSLLSQLRDEKMFGNSKPNKMAINENLQEMSMNDTQKNILEKLDSEEQAKKLDEMYDEI